MLSPSWGLARLLSTGLEVTIKSVSMVDSVAKRAPVLRSVRAKFLDTLLGPEEPFDYASITVPHSI